MCDSSTKSDVSRYNLAEEQIIEMVIRKFDAAFESAQNGDHGDSTLTDAVMLATALFITLKSMPFLLKRFRHYLLEPNKRLLKLLVWAPLRRFNEATMNLCILSWQWLLSACNEIGTDVSTVYALHIINCDE